MFKSQAIEPAAIEPQSSLPRANGARWLRLSWWTGERFLIAGVVGVAAYAVIGPGPLGDLIFFVTSAAAAAAIFGGIRVHKPAARGAWLLVGLAVFLLAAANLIAAAATVPDLSHIRSVADTLFFGEYVTLFVAAFRFGRSAHRSDRTVLLDAAIVALATTPLAWEFVIEPRIPDGALGPLTLFILAVPLVDLVLVSLVAPLVFLRASRSPSSVSFLAGLVLMGIGDSVFALGSLQDSQSADTFAGVSWLASYVLLGAAALVPSAARLGAAREPQPGAGDVVRLVVIGGALLVTPLVILKEAVDSPNFDFVVLGVLSLVIAGLLVVRLHRTIGQLGAIDRRFRRFVSHDRFLAVIKDAAGRYVYMNPAAVATRALEGTDWYGRTDADLFPPAVATHSRAADHAARTTGLPADERIDVDDRTWHTERFAIPGTNGDIGVLGFDITERVAAERAVEFQARLLGSVRDAVVVTSPDGLITYWNMGAQEMFGYSAEEMVGRPATALLASTEDEVKRIWETVLTGPTEDFDWRARRRDGGDLWLNARISPLLDEDGAVWAYLAVAKDVTGRKSAELDLARLGAAIDHALDAVIVTDEDDRLVYVNPAFEHVTGLSFEEVRGVAALDLPSCGAFGRALRQARKSKDVWRGDVVSQRSNGADLICAAVISPIAVEGQASPGFVTMARDVTHERTAERAGERRVRERMLIAETLSGLRAGTDPEATADAICGQLVKLPELAVGTVITFGHDGMATVLGQRLRDGEALPGLQVGHERSAYLRERAAAGPWVDRWIASPGHPYAELFAKYRIVANAYAPMVINGEPIGLLIVGSDRRDAVDTLTERLPALLEFSAIAATLLGGAVADRATAARSLADIQSVISEAAFTPVYQPIVELATGKVRGYEALTRFDDGTPPDVRFEEAQRLGAGLELEAASLRTAFTHAAALPAGTWLNVNVSPEAVLAGILETLLPQDSREVVIEITEHQAITDYTTFRAAIDPIRDRVQLAIDDAGAGFASLRHIVELAPTMVKLDRSLVAGIADDNAREAVVAGMVRFAQAAGLVLLAEGVETQDELRALRRLGVELGQGFLLGEPGRIDEAASDPRVASWSTPTPPRRATTTTTTRRRVAGTQAALRGAQAAAPAAPTS